MNKGVGIFVFLAVILIIIFSSTVLSEVVMPGGVGVSVQQGCVASNSNTISTPCPQNTITYSDSGGSITLQVAEWIYIYGPTNSVSFGCKCAIDEANVVSLHISDPYSHGVRGVDMGYTDDFFGPDTNLINMNIPGYPGFIIRI